LEVPVLVAAAADAELVAQVAELEVPVLVAEAADAEPVALVSELEVPVSVVDVALGAVPAVALGLVRFLGRPGTVMVRFLEVLSLQESDHQLVLNCYQLYQWALFEQLPCNSLI
jgi:hypothetical protein